MTDLLKLKALEAAIKETFGVIPTYEPAGRFGGCKDATVLKRLDPFGVN